MVAITNDERGTTTATANFFGYRCFALRISEKVEVASQKSIGVLGLGFFATSPRLKRPKYSKVGRR